MTEFIFPDVLIAIARWLVYILTQLEVGAKPAKQPFSPMTLTMGNRLEDTSSYVFAVDTLRNAVAYGTAEAHVQGPPFAGLGFRFEYDAIAPFIFIDLDNCRNPETGEIESWAHAIIERLNSYTEISPSGRGVHILCRSRRTPGEGNRKGNIEIYWRGRWAAMTGQHLANTPVDLEDRTEEVLVLHAELFPPAPPVFVAPPSISKAPRLAPSVRLTDDALLNRARTARNGAMFRTLFDEPPSRPNHSEEDLRLCSMLAFWTARDVERIDRLFRRSALMRDKWNRQDYRVRTIAKAVMSTREVFRPTTHNTPGGTRG
ncbi:MAG TPA: hypothetical protein VGN17_28630 [Bryobacteraceae bacterium]|jgi:primase-polymerase (primpol)-like protein